MAPDPAQPILDLPSRIAAEALDTAHAIAPVVVGLLVAAVLVIVGARLLRAAL